MSRLARDDILNFKAVIGNSALKMDTSSAHLLRPTPLDSRLRGNDEPKLQISTKTT